MIDADRVVQCPRHLLSVKHLDVCGTYFYNFAHRHPDTVFDTWMMQLVPVCVSTYTVSLGWLRADRAVVHSRNTRASSRR